MQGKSFPLPGLGSAQEAVTRDPEPRRNLVDFIDNDLAGTTISRYNYQNDAAGRRTDGFMTGTAFNQNTFNAYDYNDRSEVVGGQKYAGADPNAPSNPIPSYDFDYHPIGNRKTSSVVGAAPAPTLTTYTTNPLNQYTYWSSGGGTPLTPQYDHDGNMTTMPSETGTWTLEWNGENRLIRAEENSSPPKAICVLGLLGINRGSVTFRSSTIEYDDLAELVKVALELARTGPLIRPDIVENPWWIMGSGVSGIW